MRKIIFILMLLSCSSKPTQKKIISFTSIDFTYDSGFAEAFSMRINNDGIVIAKVGRRKGKFYKGKLNPSNLSSLDSLLLTIPFEKYKTEYRTNTVDQVSYKIVLRNFNKSNNIKSIFIYGESAPKLVGDLSNSLKKIMEEITLIESDTVISFNSEENFYLPVIR